MIGAWSVRACVAAYRWCLRALPDPFRSEYSDDAGRDIEQLLEQRARERGTLRATLDGFVALVALLRMIPAERLRARRVQQSNVDRPRGPSPGEWMYNVWKEVRLAARALARRPGYAMASALTLSLGIGASVAIFTVVNAVLLRPLPYPDADALVTVRHHAPGLDLPRLENSPGMIRFYREDDGFPGTLAGWERLQRNLVGGPQPERIEVTAATAEIFDVLDTAPAIGRPFVTADAQPGANPVALLTHAAWTTRFGGDPGVIGQTVVLDDRPTEVIGIMPAGFGFPDPDALALIPMPIDPEGTFGQFGIRVVARLDSGVSLDQAQRRVSALQSRVPDYFPDLTADFLDQAGWSASVTRYQDVLVGEEVASALWVVLATVGLVLLIACANVANLFLVRAESRQKERAVRAALGANGRQIAAGYLAESLVLGIAGGVVGVLLAWVGVSLLVAHGPPNLPRLHEIRMDASAVLVAALLSVATGLAFGAVPLLRDRGRAPAPLLNDGSRGATVGRERQRTRNGLVAGQLALALVLLVGSGLLLRSFQALRAVDPGFDPADVTTVGLSLAELEDDADGARFYQQVADEVAELPGVESVGLATFVPLAGGSSNGGSFHIESKPREEGALPPVAMYKGVGADYLEALRQPVLEGRALTRADWEDGVPVAVVNQSFADLHLDGRAIGQGIKWDESAEFARVVGVVADSREFELDQESGPWAYLPMVVGEWGYPNLERMTLLIRTREGIPAPVRSVREIVTRLNPTVPVTTVRTMDQVMAEDLVDTSFTLVLLGIATGVALALGAIGLFGVISYVVSQRTREIGVRVALGAQGKDIRSLFLRQGARLAAVGLAVGLVASLLLTRLMRALLYQVGTTDPATFLSASLVLVTVTILATWLPARRAARVDPIEALRTE